LWIPVGDGDRDVIIVDRKNGEAGLPNAGDEDYWLAMNRFLFQSESGSGYVRFTSVKFDKNDPKYDFHKGYIRFEVPQYASRPTTKIEILLNQ
jgi:hypothetical protein